MDVKNGAKILALPNLASPLPPNNSLMLNHIFAFTLPEIQDVPKKGTFPDFDVPFPVTGTGMKIP